MKYFMLVLALAMFLSCGQQAEAPVAAEDVVVPEKTIEVVAEESVSATEETVAVVESGLQGEELAQVQAILAKADKMDGTEDHVVHKCIGCMLNMDGSKEHAHDIAGFELHHCSENCKETFLEDSTTNILALQAKVNK